MRTLCLALLLALAGCGRAPPPAIDPGPPAPGTAPAPGPAAAPKAATLIVVTPRAAAKLREIMGDKEGPQYLRVTVDAGKFKLDVDPDADPAKDITGESQGVRFAVDRA